MWGLVFQKETEKKKTGVWIIQELMPWAPILLTWFNFNPNMDK